MSDWVYEWVLALFDVFGRDSPTHTQIQTNLVDFEKSRGEPTYHCPDACCVHVYITSPILNQNCNFIHRAAIKNELTIAAHLAHHKTHTHTHTLFGLFIWSYVILCIECDLLCVCVCAVHWFMINWTYIRQTAFVGHSIPITNIGLLFIRIE